MIYRAGNDVNIPRLPENLEVALNKMKESELAREILGEHIYSRFVALKEKEVEDYKKEEDIGNTLVTDYEIERDYPIL
ncbi:MAG: hypothetical protein J7L31_06355 [Thermoplasmata archaeon]|nr:hypothetical protein [Thermoplasmata archaeon]